LHAEVVSKLISIFLVGHSSASFVLSRVWQANQSLVINSMIALHRQEPTLLSRILDVAQDLKVGTASDFIRLITA
jgi:CCR4-NOT transcription complex subunit 1